MLWFSVASIIIYTPLALVGGKLFLAEAFIEEGLLYYQVLVYGCPLFLIQSAISGFFIGIGRTKLVTMIVLAGNGLNIILNYLLIFGIGNVPAMGAFSAALASIIAEFSQVLALLYVFLNRHHNQLYQTRKPTFDLKLLWERIKIGIPNAAGWAFLTNLRAHFGTDYIVVMTITSTSYIFFTFFTDGIHKGVTAIVSNFIGAEKYNYITKLKYSAYKIQITVAVLLFFPMVVFNDFIIRSMIDVSTFFDTAIYGIRLAMLGNFLFMATDGFFWIYAEMLTAGGDTKSLMIVNSTAVWLICVILSVVWLTYFPSESYTVSLYSSPLYAAAVTTLLYFRVRNGGWVKLNLAKSI